MWAAPPTRAPTPTRELPAGRRANGYNPAARVGAARMGNIRPTCIKAARSISASRHYPNDFNGDFANNKRKVLELTDLGVPVEGGDHATYKKLANRIAGYTVRYVKRKRGT